MRTRIFIIFILVAVTFATACDNNKEKNPVPSTDFLLKGDKTVYGYACEGCNDSVVVLLPSDMSDPVKYDIIKATHAHKILGKLKIGDWIAVVLSPLDKKVADLVIDLDDLQGIWCYTVMPEMRDYAQMSKHLQARMMQEMPDSIRETYLIPREYGFVLKRQWNASSVGYVPPKSSLEDESPVVYPPLSYFKEWHIWNGKLIMVSGKPTLQKDNSYGITDITYDTCDINYLNADSLVLSSEGASRCYYRKNNINEINKKARFMAEKLQKKALEDSKNR